MIAPESIDRAVQQAGAAGASHITLSVTDAAALAQQIRLGNQARVKLVVHEGVGGIAAMLAGGAVSPLPAPSAR